MAEEIIYRSGPATVTRTLIRISGTSYPVNGIGSVRIEPSPAPGAIFLGLCAAVAGLIWHPFLFIVAAAFGYIALTARAKLVIRTSSGDQTALTAMRQRALTPVMEAIEQAVSIRG